MNKCFIIAGIVFFSFKNSNAQVLFSYGKKQVTKQEFLNAYNKNPSTITDRKKGLEEYRNLYINYKLKVQSSLDDKQQDNPIFRAESENFKRQITDNIVNEEANGKQLLEEAFERSQKDLEVSQIFIAFDADNKAGSEINKAYTELKTGADFIKVLNKFCNDEAIKATSGYVGFITAFTLPYEIETLVYNLKEKGFSTPFKSNYGWHIFKLNSIRAAVGKRKIAQILLTIPPNADAATKSKILTQATDIYNQLIGGAKFTEFAQLYSEDYSTASLGGEIGEIGIGKYEKIFEDQVFAIKQKNDISKPFETPFGIHILKLLEILPVSKTMDEPIFASTLKLKLEASDRLAFSKKNLVKKWMQKIGYRKAFFNEQQVFDFVDSNILNKNTTQFLMANDSTLLFAFANKNFKVYDFIQAVKTAKFSGSPEANKSYKELLTSYEEEMASAYYKDHLEEFNTSMKQQLKEFDEANLLFAGMDKNVWSKAAEDTIGLRKFYESRKTSYKWQPGVAAITISANSKTISETLYDKVKANPSNWREIVNAEGAKAAADSSRFEMEQLPIKQKITLKEGVLSNPEKSPSDDSYTFIYVTKVYKAVETRDFSDARGLAMNEYQLLLEENWINALKKKYPIKVNEQVWKTVK